MQRFFRRIYFLLLILTVISLLAAVCIFQQIRQAQQEPFYYNQARLLTNAIVQDLTGQIESNAGEWIFSPSASELERLQDDLMSIRADLQILDLTGRVHYDSTGEATEVDLAAQLHYDAGYAADGRRMLYTFPLILDGRQVAMARFQIERSQISRSGFWQSPWAYLLPPGLLGLAIWLVLIVLNIRFQKCYERPLRDLQTAARALGRGDFSQALTVPADSELAELSLTMDRMRLELSDALAGQARSEQARQDLVTQISHELRTPVASIKAYSEGLSDGIARDPEQLQRYANIIRQKSDSLSRLVDDLFEQSLRASGQLRLQVQDCYSAEFFSRILTPLALTYASTGVQLALPTTRPEELPDVLLRIDPDRIEQVVLNLVHNAVKYTPEGGTVRVSIVNREDYLQIAVSDTGQGVAETDLPHIFESFYRGSTVRRFGPDGAGLGLAICKTIIDLHGGRLSVQSKLGSGSTFAFILPKS